MDIDGFQITTIANDDLAAVQRGAIFGFLIQQCFTDVSHQEIEEDHFVAPMAYVQCYRNGEMAGCGSAYAREIEYKGQMMRLGGIVHIVGRRQSWSRD